MTAILDSEAQRPGLFHGVDFSAAANAGRNIWIAAGRATGDGLTIEDCRPAERLPGGGRRRHQALAALREWIAGQGVAAIGMDFPFGLPLPLVRDGVACVPPMQPLQRAKPRLLEIRPASALKALGLYRPYKGRRRSLRAARRALLEALSDRLGLSFSAEIRRTALENVGGDALDSIVAAWCAWQVAGTWPSAAAASAAPLPAEAMLEAWVFLPDGANAMGNDRA